MNIKLRNKNKFRKNGIEFRLITGLHPYIDKFDHKSTSLKIQNIFMYGFFTAIIQKVAKEFKKLNIFLENMKIAILKLSGMLVALMKKFLEKNYHASAIDNFR